MTSIHSQYKWKKIQRLWDFNLQWKHTPSGVGSAKNQRPSTVDLRVIETAPPELASRFLILHAYTEKLASQHSF